MKNKEMWKPSKFVYIKNCLVASRDPSEVAVSSRLMANLIARYYATYIPMYAKGKLVDLGCGKVPLYEVYKNYVIDNVCVDWPNTLHKNAFLDYECDISEPLPFNDGTFDTIILSDVLEHIAQPEKLFSEMTRILNANGVLILNVPFFYRLHEIPFDYYRYTEFTLRRFAVMNKLEILQLESIGGVPEILADITSKSIVMCPYVGKYMAILVQNIIGIIIETKIGKKLSRVTSKDFPLGYFMVTKKSSDSKL